MISIYYKDFDIGSIYLNNSVVSFIFEENLKILSEEIYCILTMNLVSVDFKRPQIKCLHLCKAELNQPDKLKYTFLKDKGYFGETKLRSKQVLISRKNIQSLMSVQIINT